MGHYGNKSLGSFPLYCFCIASPSFKIYDRTLRDERLSGLCRQEAVRVIHAMRSSLKYLYLISVYKLAMTVS